MKKLYLASLIICIPFLASAQAFKFNSNFGAGFHMPVNRMSNQFKFAYGAFIDAGAKHQLTRLNFLASFSFSEYSSFSEQQPYMFGSYVTYVKTTYTSGFRNYGARIQWDILNNTRVVPFIEAGGGYMHFRSRVSFYDYGEFDDCAPIDQKSVLSSGTGYGNFGAGVRLDLGSLINSSWRDDRFFCFASVNYLLGGKVDYLVARKFENPVIVPTGPTTPRAELEGHEHDHGHGNSNTDYRGDYQLEFLNVPTGEIHKHKVAEIFQNRVSMLEVRIGFSWRF